MVRGPQWYYVVDTQNSVLFNVIVTISDVFVMPTLFFLAGFFGVRSLLRTGQVAFWRSKVVRIVIPFFMGILFLAPAVNYIYFLSRLDTPPAYLDYWWNIFFWSGAPTCAFVVFGCFDGVLSRIIDPLAFL